MKKLSCLLVTILIAPLVFAQQQAKAPVFKAISGAFFVVTRNHYAEGFTPGGPTTRFGDVILIGFLDGAQVGSRTMPNTPESAEASDYYEKKYFKVGNRFRLFRGGADVGAVRIQKVLPFQCDSSAAVASIEGNTTLSEKDFAIATTSPVASHRNPQAPVEPLQKQLANEWVRAYLGKRKASGTSEIMRSLQTAIDESGSKCLVFEWAVNTKQVLRNLLVVGHIAKGQFVPELIRHHHTNDVEDGKDFEPESFVDQIDIDGDKIDELIFEQTGYESEQFLVYKWNGLTWKNVWVGGQGGC